jgi:hypothetical protein
MTKELTQTISWNTTKWLPEERTELEKEFGYISILIAQNGGVIPGKYSTKHKRFFDWDAEPIGIEFVDFWSYMPKHPTK